MLKKNLKKKNDPLKKSKEISQNLFKKPNNFLILISRLFFYIQEIPLNKKYRISKEIFKRFC